MAQGISTRLGCLGYLCRRVACPHRTVEISFGEASVHLALTSPTRLWSAAEVLTRPSPVPAAAGVYGWHFDEAPAQDLDAGRLLYVGIAPRHMSNRSSTQNLRKRVRYHFRGNAAGSTLRLTLGCLLGLELRRVGSGGRMTFGRVGEASLTEWMAEHARVCWLEHEEPWTMESDLIARLDVPLNLDQNRRNGFHATLSKLRADARARARQLPVTA
ncbi:GIY-YIG nuclease family protein [Streptomyces sp. NBC_01794]|uniref:GIY-YIG nuclease family protein n=1 Tax=Streptomyces sp. NBC_01794 TaxID=2975942 RepID=UPI003873148E